jgi:hypothetical protein
MTLSIKTIGKINIIVTLNINDTKHFSLTETVSILTLSIKTISKIDIIVTLSITGTNDYKPINDIPHNDTQYKDNKYM